ncbi:uncharacterized protein L969DRAFT_440092 [Mixia osmundae IAM 14324]|uniref:Threonine dehydratase n=1 Tax=Mixia osmundae (strain CBS 9802 / IAM 14324 / JCM 22182 / KY 12970) TaxID=764103 RepID=G7E3D4_MIXOS|nr:uncharacterized protein L969DRAFT_440092 [Mixia osmundae IAM 14324]KEI39330.1 hypothetical protein L969DRAFT_440092 [Mixia osmundae IAM 14324]GAA97344.1 hypothetical protein E5Q_04022 [Mixia osmundae IAM 14324]
MAIVNGHQPEASTSTSVTKPAEGMYARLPKHCILPDGTPDYVRLALTSRVYELVQPTPLNPAVSLSSRMGCQILMKREDLQPVFSFKIRGAYNLMSALTEDERWRGVIACSAGNHAQGVALAGSKLGIACTIVMPLNTPAIKWLNVERYGAKVVLHGTDFDEAKLECARLAHAHQLVNIPPYDEPYVIAGQGTIGVEILRQTNPDELDAIFVCVGGGGLLAGVAAYVKQIAPPRVKVIGVETYDQNALTASLRGTERVSLKEVGLFADGTAVRIVGEETFRVCSNFVDEMVSVSNDEVCAAIKDIFEDTRAISEPSGALAVAGMKKYIQQNQLVGSNKRFVGIVSGANMNFDRLRFVAERAELGEKREALICVTLPEQEGSFLKLHSCIHPRSITEFSYRYSSPAEAHAIFAFHLAAGQVPGLGIVDSPQAARQAELEQIMQSIVAAGMKVTDLSENELAKSHARYLVGGRKSIPNERVFRFEFPERPGALRKYLQGISQGLFNVTLFHYRGQGGDVARVLAAIQVPPERTGAFEVFLSELGYKYAEETDNPVYRMFLQE